MTSSKIYNYHVFAVFFLIGAAQAQDATDTDATASDADAAPAAQPSPCADDPNFAEFDFWVGTWDVHDNAGNLAGRNVIERTQGGCLVTENWTGSLGGTGTSINYLDQISGKWVQVWNDANGTQINISGGLTETGMLLEGTIHYIANGTTAPFRGLWTPLDDGRVRQFFEQSNDDGETWVPWFEGFYTRVASE